MSIQSFSEPTFQHRYILGMRVDATNYTHASEKTIAWALQGKGLYICASNVHMTMETWGNPQFRDIVNNAALVTPDGMPLVWSLKALGVKGATRVYGPTLMLHVCEAAAIKNIPIALYGGTEKSLEMFSEFLERKFPNVDIACKISPPFRALTEAEDHEYTQSIIDSGARVLLVGIGCPKQELWMFSHQDKIPAVMLGVGAAFDFHSGRVKQSPEYLQELGLEWAFRLVMEPRRLWKRYIYNNPRFIVLFAIQWIANKIGLKISR